MKNYSPSFSLFWYIFFPSEGKSLRVCLCVSHCVYVCVQKYLCIIRFKADTAGFCEIREALFWIDKLENLPVYVLSLLSARSLDYSDQFTQRNSCARALRFLSVWYRHLYNSEISSQPILKICARCISISGFNQFCGTPIEWFHTWNGIYMLLSLKNHLAFSYCCYCSGLNILFCVNNFFLLFTGFCLKH